jgi:hypothetical protein
MTLNTKQLSECFYKAITEHVPLQDKITQYITLQETNKPHTASRIKRRNKNLSSKTISHNNSNPNIDSILTMNSNNNNTMSKCMNTTDLLKEKYLLRKHCEILKNRIGTLMLQEKEVKSKINYKKAKETSIEKIKQDKEKSKQMIEKLKKDNAKKVLDQKEKVNKARKTENNNLQRSKKNNYESKKYLYQSFINNKNKAISEQLVAGNYNNQFDISPSLFVRKHHTNYHSAERDNKDKEILEKELLDLQKAEQMFKLLNYHLVLERADRLVYEHRLYPYVICFDNERRTVCKYERKFLFYIDERTLEPMYIRFSEIQAINQQVKELGWIE